MGYIILSFFCIFLLLSVAMLNEKVKETRRSVIMLEHLRREENLINALKESSIDPKRT
jgi:hypothetical protein